MSLNYNYSCCKPAIEVLIAEYVEQGESEDDAEIRVYGIIDAMIWRTLILGINGYTEKNHDDVMKRIRFEEALFGDSVIKTDSETGERTDVPTPEFWVKLVDGMTVNVTPESWSRFKNKMIKQWEREYTRSLELEEQE